MFSPDCAFKSAQALGNLAQKVAQVEARGDGVVDFEKYLRALPLLRFPLEVQSVFDCEGDLRGYLAEQL
jgi:hypothetical protein